MADFLSLTSTGGDLIPAEQLALVATLWLTFLIVGVLVYIYQSFAMMKTAQRLGVDKPWLAWIPVANLVLLARMAKMPAWPVWFLFGLFIPFLNFLIMLGVLVFSIIWTWKVCEFRGKPGWLSILVIIPYVGSLWQLILWGILAWGGDGSAPAQTAPAEKPKPKEASPKK